MLKYPEKTGGHCEIKKKTSVEAIRGIQLSTLDLYKKQAELTVAYIPTLQCIVVRR